MQRSLSQPPRAPVLTHCALLKDLRAQRAQESFQPPLKILCDFLKTSG
jgi:hypothetical protein